MKSRHPGVEVDISFVPADPAGARCLTRAQVEHFNTDGYVSGLRLLEVDQVPTWRAWFDANRLRLSDFSSGFKAFHHEVRELYDLVVTPRLVAWMNDLLGQDVVCHTSMYITKEAGDASVIAWHQDCSYNPMDARSVVIWIAFDDATVENGCMWFIPGSHRLGQLEFDKNPSGVLETRDAESFGAPVAMPVKAGEAVIFSDQLLHMSRGNITTDRPRRTFNATYTNTRLVPHLHKGDWAVLCSGQLRHDHWKCHARP